MAMNLDERLYDYLESQESSKSIGEINAEAQFKDIPRRELAQQLQTMSSQGDVFRSLQNGKAYYSTKVGDGLSRNPGQQRLADLQNALNNLGQPEEVKLMKKVGDAFHDLEDALGIDDNSDTTNYDVDVSDIQLTFYEQQMADCDEYTMLVPDGFVITKQEGRQFVAYLKNPKATDIEWNMGGSLITIMDSTFTPMEIFEQNKFKLLDIYSTLYENVYWTAQRTLLAPVFQSVDLFPIKTKTTAGAVVYAGEFGSHHYYVSYFNGHGYKQIRLQIDSIVGKVEAIHKLVLQIAEKFALKNPVEPLQSLNDPYFLDGELTEAKALEWRNLFRETDNEHGILWNFRNRVEESRANYERRECTFSELQLKKRIRTNIKKRAEDADMLLEQAVAFCESAKKDANNHEQLVSIYDEILCYLDECEKIPYKLTVEGVSYTEKPATIDTVRERLFTDDVKALMLKYQSVLGKKKLQEKQVVKNAILKGIEELIIQVRELVSEIDQNWEDALNSYQEMISYTTYMSQAELDRDIRDLVRQRNEYGNSFNDLIKQIDQKAEEIVEAGGDYRAVKCIRDLIDEVIRKSDCLDLDINANGTYNGRYSSEKFSVSWSSKKIAEKWSNRYKEMPEVFYEKKIQEYLKIKENVDTFENPVLDEAAQRQWEDALWKSLKERDEKIEISRKKALGEVESSIAKILEGAERRIKETASFVEEKLQTWENMLQELNISLKLDEVQLQEMAGIKTACEDAIDNAAKKNEKSSIFNSVDKAVEKAKDEYNKTVQHACGAIQIANNPYRSYLAAKAKADAVASLTENEMKAYGIVSSVKTLRDKKDMVYLLQQCEEIFVSEEEGTAVVDALLVKGCMEQLNGTLIHKDPAGNLEDMPYTTTEELVQAVETEISAEGIDTEPFVSAAKKTYPKEEKPFEKEKERIAELSKQQAELLIRIEKRLKRKELITILLGAVIIIAITAGALFLIDNHLKSKVYDTAKVAMESEDYANAVGLFDVVEDYKDSAKLKEEAKKSFAAAKVEDDYQTALEVLEDSDFHEAEVLFQKLGDYKDSTKKVKKAQQLQKKQISENIRTYQDYFSSRSYFETKRQYFDVVGDKDLKTLLQGKWQASNEDAVFYLTFKKDGTGSFYQKGKEKYKKKLCWMVDGDFLYWNEGDKIYKDGDTVKFDKKVNKKTETYTFYYQLEVRQLNQDYYMQYICDMDSENWETYLLMKKVK